MIRYLTLLVMYCWATVVEANNWTQRADFGGSVRFGAFAFANDSLGYMGGGYASGNNYNDFWQYNPSTDAWTQMSSYPLAVRLAGSFVINGNGYVVGGRASSITVADMFMYDPLLNQWISKAVFPGVAIYGGASFSINGKGYFGIGNGGGATGAYYTAFYQYNATTDTWQQKATFPGMPRYGTYGIAVNGNGYAGFGKNDASGVLFNDWWEYNPISNSWQAKTNLPATARSYPSGFVIGNNIYLGTGGTDTLSMNDFYKYNPTLNHWTAVQNYSGNNTWVAAAFAINDTGYLGTGFDEINYLREFWQFVPDTTVGISNIQSEMNIVKFFPNPAKDYLTLTLPLSNGTNNFKIDITDAAGKQVYNTTAATSNFKLQILNFAPGIYTLTATSGKHSVTKKLVKE